VVCNNENIKSKLIYLEYKKEIQKELINDNLIRYINMNYKQNHEMTKLEKSIKILMKELEIYLKNNNLNYKGDYKTIITKLIEIKHHENINYCLLKNLNTRNKKKKKVEIINATTQLFRKLNNQVTNLVNSDFKKNIITQNDNKIKEKIE